MFYLILTYTINLWNIYAFCEGLIRWKVALTVQMEATLALKQLDRAKRYKMAT